MPERNLESELRATLSAMARRDLSAVALDADLILELGLDSLAGLRLLAAVEKQFHVRFPDRRLGEFRTLRQLLEFLAHPEPSAEPT
jgi:acyl carrier protein